MALSEQEYARGMVNRAIKSGKLIRAKFCNRCGKEDAKQKGGRTNIHGHHHDYSKPLDVEWICSQCHRKETPCAYGEGTGSVKLTKDDVIFIRQSKMLNKDLMKKFCVSRTTIQRARSGTHWGWLNG